MATSSIKKSFSLSTRTQTNIFMQKFEEHLSCSQNIKRCGVKMPSDKDVEKMIAAWKKSK